MTKKTMGMPTKAAAPPRVRGVKRPPMKASFIGNFLDKKKRPKRKLTSNSEVSKYILALALKDLDGKPITGPDPVTDEIIAKQMASEIAAAVNRTGGKSARNWYTDAITRAIRVAGMMQPEILDSDYARDLMPGQFANAMDAQTILFAAMAITSQSVPVNENMRYALEQYRAFMKVGRFQPKGYGVKGSSIKNNLARFNQMLDLVEGDIGRLRNFLDTEFTVREIKEAGAEFNIRIASKEMIDEKVTGSVVFGPKIGAFFQNLSGNHDPLTMDLWYCRTWGRYTGTLVRDDVSPAQVERLSETLNRDLLGLTNGLRESGAEFDPTTLDDIESGDLEDLAAILNRFWERKRKALVASGFVNHQISTIKSELGWPGASESIMKSLSGTVDQPGSGSRRRWMRSVTKRALQILERNGYPMTTADAQATLWYPEKSLYSHLSNRKEDALNVSYDEAMITLAKIEGFSDEQIRTALHTNDSPELGGHIVSAAAERGEPEPVPGDDLIVDQTLREPEDQESVEWTAYHELMVDTAGVVEDELQLDDEPTYVFAG